MRPLRLVPELPPRSYDGGALLARFHGGEATDGVHPEEWIGSVTTTADATPQNPLGLSRVADGRFLRDVIAADPVAWLGEQHLRRYGTETGLLVKLLDSAQRLPVHAHPDRAWAACRLGSRWGKTEGWIILDTREARGGDLWLGLREPLALAELRALVEAGDTRSMLERLNHLVVRPGDVILVPGGVPHSIGAGILMCELQEPSDLNIHLEWEGFRLYDSQPPDLGLGWDVTLTGVDLAAHTPIRAIDDRAADYFACDARCEPAGRFAVLLVTAGAGTLDGEPVRRGDSFALPAACEPFAVEGELEVLRCLPPRS
jgi:mannose-6-phosphate isomerase